jgi:hypothetical protein
MDDESQVDIARIEREQADARTRNGLREHVHTAVIRVSVPADWLEALDLSDFDDDELNRICAAVSESVATLRKLQRRLEDSFGTCVACGASLPQRREFVRYCSHACRRSACQRGVDGGRR